MAIRVRARVKGRVQGVSFRYYTIEEAEALGLVGWVRNRSDGSVELEAEGEEAAVEQLLAWVRQGPPAAKVTAVEVERIAPTGADHEFRVRH